MPVIVLQLESHSVEVPPEKRHGPELPSKLHYSVYFSPDVREVYENYCVHLTQDSPVVIVLSVHRAYDQSQSL